MSVKMNWTRDRKSGVAYGPSGEDRRLERAVNRILAEPSQPTRAPQGSSHRKGKPRAANSVGQIAEGLSEALAIAQGGDGARYRAAGSVILIHGDWHAVDAAGSDLGAFPSRAAAWRRAEELGFQPI